MNYKRLIALLLALVLVLGALPLQAFAVNPFLPLWERIPDGEPRVFTDPETGEERVYVYGSHDLINIANERRYCGVDHVVWSAPVDDLSDWRHEGIVFQTTDLIGVEYISKELGGQPRIIDSVDNYVLYAPDVVYHPTNDTYYMFLFLSGPNATGDLTSTIFVATSKSPAGPFTNPKYVCDGFDPAVLIDDVKNEDGKERVYLYWSVRETRAGWACELDPDTMKPIPGTTRGPRDADGIVTDEKTFMDQKFAPFHFFEGPSIRKIEDTYVLSYARSKNGGLAEIGYATSDNPFGSPALGSEWEYGGVIISNKGEAVVNPYNPEATVNTFTGGNNHGGLFELNGQWYQVYHRTTERGYERQAMVEAVNLYFDENHKLIIEQAEQTSMGFEADGLDPYKPLSASTVCYLFTYPNPATANRVGIYTNPELNFDPNGEHPTQYPVYKISNQTWLGYKYFNFGDALTDENKLTLSLSLMDVQPCTLKIYANDAKETFADPEQPKTLLATLELPGGSTEFRTVEAAIPTLSGMKGIYFEFLSEASGEVCQLAELQFSKTDCPSSAFLDMPAFDNWAHAGIDYCVENGLMNGYSATEFAPEEALTRAQLVTILYRAAGQPAVTAAPSFRDVAANRYYYNAIAWAAQNGIVNGFGDGTFGPNLMISREQIAAILYRYAGQPAVTGSLEAFADAANVSAYARDAMLWATSTGLINGNASKLNPSANATRAQAAAMLMRYLEAK